MFLSVPGYVCMYVKICASPLCVCVCVHVCICITCILVTWVHEYLDSCAFPYVCVCAHVTLQMCQCPKGCIVSIRGHAHHESESESHSVSPTLCNPVVYTVRGQLFGTLWAVAHQASLSMDFSRQEYWGGLSFPSPWGHRQLDTTERLSLHFFRGSS